MIDPAEFITAIEKMRSFHGNAPLDLLVPIPLDERTAAAVEACGVRVRVSPWLAQGKCYIMPSVDADEILKAPLIGGDDDEG